LIPIHEQTEAGFEEFQELNPGSANSNPSFSSIRARNSVTGEEDEAEAPTRRKSVRRTSGGIFSWESHRKWNWKKRRKRPRILRAMDVPEKEGKAKGI